MKTILRHLDRYFAPFILLCALAFTGAYALLIIAMET